MSHELKPCPFCGGKVEEFTDANGFRNYFCTKCPCALSGDFEHHATARKAWNTRAESAELVASREREARLIEALEKLARLGNEPHYGNSIGNRIAQDALSQSGAPTQSKCAAQSSIGANDPQDCDWPMCGCDEHANKVISALEECGYLVEQSSALAQPNGGEDVMSNDAKERLKFVRWAYKEGLNLDGIDTYTSVITQTAWIAWQASRN